MITAKPLVQAAQIRLAHRAFFDADGTVRFVLENGSAVRLTARQWARAQDDFETAIRPANRGLKWGFTLAIPMMIATLSVESVFKLSKAIDAMGHTISMLVMVLELCWWPFLMMFLHWRAIRNARRDLDEQLSGMPSAPKPPRQPRNLQPLEIIAIVLFGPGIVIDIIGSVSPHAFDATPFMGRQLEPFSIIGLLAVSVIMIVPRVQRWRARARA